MMISPEAEEANSSAFREEKSEIRTRARILQARIGIVKKWRNLPRNA
jgi:hypothetical protein